MAGDNELVVRLVGDSRDLERALKKGAKAGDEFKNALSKASKGAIVGLGALAVGAGLAVRAASNLGEQINKTAVVFRGSEKAIHNWSKTTASSFGISQRAALEAAGTFGNMLVPMGIARDRAGEMSKRFVELAADMASFNNASPEDTLEALRSGLAGETEPLRKFGVFLNAARVEQEALNLGLKKGKQPLDAAAKAQATYSIILKDTADAQGDFARTSDSLANQERILRAELEDTAAALGTALLPAATAVAGVLVELVNAARDNETAVKALGIAAAALASGIILLNTSLNIYNSTALAAIKATKGLRIALALTPWGLAAVAAAGLVEFIMSQSRESEKASDSQRKLADAVRDYNNAIKQGNNAREEYGSASRRVEAAEISLARAQQARRQLLKDDNATLLDRRDANLAVASAQAELRAAEESSVAAGTKLRNQQLGSQAATVRAREAVEDLAKEYRDWAKGIGPGGRIDTALERNKAGIKDVTFQLHTGRVNAERYADKLRAMAATMQDSQPKLAETARLAARLADAWGRVVSLPAAREFVARFSVFTTVETNRQIPGGGNAQGGVVQRGGLALIHGGERILPARVARGGAGSSSGGAPTDFALIAAGPDFMRWLDEQQARRRRKGHLG